MHYALRIAVPDRPGAFAAVATALGAAGVDIAALTVIDRADGIAVDDLRVETPLPPGRLRGVLEGVPGVVVESLCAGVAPGRSITATALAAAVAQTPLDPVGTLIHGLPAALAADWAVAVDDGTDGFGVTVASPEAPAWPVGLRPPFLPARRTTRAAQAAWMPREWRAPAPHRVELATAGLDSPTAAVVLARRIGPRFRPPELRRLEELARIAVAVLAPSAAVPAPAG